MKTITHLTVKQIFDLGRAYQEIKNNSYMISMGILHDCIPEYSKYLDKEYSEELQNGCFFGVINDMKLLLMDNDLLDSRKNEFLYKRFVQDDEIV